MRDSARFFHILGRHMEKRIPQVAPEIATVISADPLVIQLDMDTRIQLNQDDQDILVSDTLILQQGDKVIVEQLMGGNRAQYAVMVRLRGTRGKAYIGSKESALGVVRFGDTGPGFAVDGHVHSLQPTASTKVFVE